MIYISMYLKLNIDCTENVQRYSKTQCIGEKIAIFRQNQSSGFGNFRKTWKSLTDLVLYFEMVSNISQVDVNGVLDVQLNILGHTTCSSSSCILGENKIGSAVQLKRRLQ